jgi:predicted transcriptional regulator
MGKHRKLAMASTSVRIPVALWNLLGQVADRKRMSRTQLLERALVLYCFIHSTAETMADLDQLGEVATEEWEMATKVLTKSFSKKR